MSWIAFVVVLGFAAGLVALAVVRKADPQTLTAVIGFAGSLVTGTFGLAVSRSRSRSEP